MFPSPTLNYVISDNTHSKQGGGWTSADGSPPPHLLERELLFTIVVEEKVVLCLQLGNKTR